MIICSVSNFAYSALIGAGLTAGFIFLGVPFIKHYFALRAKKDKN